MLKQELTCVLAASLAVFADGQDHGDALYAAIFIQLLHVACFPSLGIPSLSIEKLPDACTDGVDTTRLETCNHDACFPYRVIQDSPLMQLPGYRTPSNRCRIIK